MTDGWRPSGRIRPSRWAWTTVTGTILLAILLFSAIVLASDVAERHPFSDLALEMLELGFLVGLLPAIGVWVLAWRIRHQGEEVDETASATFGTLAIVTLAIGIATALLSWPSRPKDRLALQTALSLIGAALLVASAWVRHVPRPWWPREDVSG